MVAANQEKPIVCRFVGYKPFVGREVLRGLLVVAMLQLGVAGLWAGEVAVTILHTNDIHQDLEHLPQIAAYVADYRQRHPETVFIDAGDFFDRGSSMVPLTRGEAIYAAMSLMDYDLRIVGNHDWSYGSARLRELIAGYPGIVLGTNLATNQPPLPNNVRRTVIKEFQGIRVGFFGITLDTYGKNSKLRPELYVLDAQAETARAVAELKPQVDLIVAVTHIGLNRMSHETQRACPSDVDLVRANPGIQVVVGGHSHTLVAEQETRRLYDQTGSIIVQAGDAGKWIGRLTLRVDQDTRRIRRFEIEHVDTSKLELASPKVAQYIQSQYDRYLPNAKTVLGQFAEPMEFYNLAYWYADFVRQQADADIALVPRKSLYDEPKTFPRGPLTVEGLYGYVHQRYLIRAQVQGRDLLEFCRSEAVCDRFNPFHHQGRPFSGDAIYCSGMSARYRPEGRTVDFSIDPQRTYTLVAPWPFDEATARKYRGQLPDRDGALTGPFIPGLKVKDAVVLPKLSRDLLVSVGMKEGLKFTRRYPQPDPEWGPWTSHFEERLKSPTH
jgi:2',3'-cyclic-nucleotide 2'-phosphodiesterase (5'-nucleotidase family)